MEKIYKEAFIFIVGILLIVSGILTYEFRPTKEITPRNNYGEILLGLNADPRPPTSNDLIQGYARDNSGKTFVIFESREIEDIGMTSYWRVD